MDVSVEIHCDRCGSANLSIPGESRQSAPIACNDCGEELGTVAELKEQLLAAALRQGSEALRQDLDRLRDPPSG